MTYLAIVCLCVCTCAYTGEVSKVASLGVVSLKSKSSVVVTTASQSKKRGKRFISLLLLVNRMPPSGILTYKVE